MKMNEKNKQVPNQHPRVARTLSHAKNQKKKCFVFGPREIIQFIHDQAQISENKIGI